MNISIVKPNKSFSRYIICLSLLAFIGAPLASCTPKGTATHEKEPIKESPQTDGKEPFCGISFNTGCISDSDCAIGGCSGEICMGVDEARDILSACEWRECYDAPSYGMECGCFNGGCSWGNQ